jgi:hypothetical protein
MKTSKEQKEEMRKEVLEFVQQQPGYSGQELRVMCDEPDWFILYGSNGMSGIAGYGKTAKEAVEDFKNSWKQLNGEKWIKNNLRIL